MNEKRPGNRPAADLRQSRKRLVVVVMAVPVTTVLTTVISVMMPAVPATVMPAIIVMSSAIITAPVAASAMVAVARTSVLVIVCVPLTTMPVPGAVIVAVIVVATMTAIVGKCGRADEAQAHHRRRADRGECPFLHIERPFQKIPGDSKLARPGSRSTIRSAHERPASPLVDRKFCPIQ